MSLDHGWLKAGHGPVNSISRRIASSPRSLTSFAFATRRRNPGEGAPFMRGTYAALMPLASG
jgi:hypothetical protein